MRTPTRADSGRARRERFRRVSHRLSCVGARDRISIADSELRQRSVELGNVVSQDELILHVERERRNGRRIVFTNGCFDLLHPGHVRCLEQARALGDLLIVAINSDTSVRRMKGEERPVVPEAERAEVLAALTAVDYVTIFEEDTPREIITRIMPEVLVKGGDWGPDQIVGRTEVESAGGRVESIPLSPAPSTTALIEKIREL